MSEPAHGPASTPSGTADARGGTPRPLLLYDGVCGFCDATVQFVLKRDPGGSMRFATLQGGTAEKILERHPELRGVDSLVLVEGPGERVSIRSGAVLRLCAYVGGVWRMAVLLRLVPRPVRDWAYDLFARHRYRVFGRYDACPVPSPEVRARFLD